jgi:hypothetical protein
LKLKCDEPLSNVAFNFNLRRYNAAELEAHKAEALNAERRHEVGRCRLIASKPELKARLVSALESKM